MDLPSFEFLIKILINCTSLMLQSLDNSLFKFLYSNKWFLIQPSIFPHVYLLPISCFPYHWFLDLQDDCYYTIPERWSIRWILNSQNTILAHHIFFLICVNPVAFSLYYIYQTNFPLKDWLTYFVFLRPNPPWFFSMQIRSNITRIIFLFSESLDHKKKNSCRFCLSYHWYLW